MTLIDLKQKIFYRYNLEDCKINNICIGILTIKIANKHELYSIFYSLKQKIHNTLTSAIETLNTKTFPIKFITTLGCLKKNCFIFLLISGYYCLCVCLCVLLFEMSFYARYQILLCKEAS
jgi:hypothetical protein